MIDSVGGHPWPRRPNHLFNLCPEPREHRGIILRHGFGFRVRAIALHVFDTADFIQTSVEVAPIPIRLHGRGTRCVGGDAGRAEARDPVVV